MANTTHGPYVPTAYTTTMTLADATNLEKQAGIALASLNPDLIGAAFIDGTGVACVKDTTTTTQLNVTSGKAYLLMTDGTNARIDIASTTFSSSGHASSTLFLDLNPDGTWSFATTHSVQANFLPICQVTTDGSSNITGVADKRVMSAQLLAVLAQTSAGQPGGLALPSPLKALLTQSAGLAGTVVGGVTFGQVGALRGSMDTAASFNGSTGYITLPTTGLPTGNAAWSLEGWFKTSVTGTFKFIVGMGGAASKTGAFLYVADTNKLVGDLFSANIASSATVTDGLWHHAALTWDGTTLTLYLDGASVNSSATLGPDNISYGAATIGAQFVTSYINLMNGALDECAIYGTALSSTRILAHYNAGLSTTTDAYAAAVLADSPLRYYRLGDAVGATSAASSITPTASTVVDAGGNIFGSLGGGPLSAVGTSASQTGTSVTDITGCTLTAPVAGKYLVMAHMQAGVVNSAGSITMLLSVNGAYPGVDPQFVNNTSGFITTIMSYSWVVTVAAGQVLKLQFTASSLSTTVNGQNSTIIAQYLHS